VTLAPLVNPTIRGVAGKPVKLGDQCATPLCQEQAQQRHHLWPKSYLRGQPFEWVSVNGEVYANSVGLCMEHHDDVSSPVGGHKAKIVFNEKLKLFEWWEVDRDWFCVGPLNQDSPLIPVGESREQEGNCPSCGRPHRVRASALPRRKTKTWGVKVPDDAEDGAAVLDEYIDDLSVALGFGDESKGVRRFHVLANVLLWVTQMKPEFLADWQEAQDA
jgi:hypothetical protein